MVRVLARFPLPKIEVGVALAHPAVRDGIGACTRGVWVGVLRLPQPHPETVRHLRVPQTLPTASVIRGKVVLVAIWPRPIPSSEREAAMGTEMVSVDRNERDVMVRRNSHGAI
jgi:hypothetical protein